MSDRTDRMFWPAMKIVLAISQFGPVYPAGATHLAVDGFIRVAVALPLIWWAMCDLARYFDKR
jgi:hypothetical protein